MNSTINWNTVSEAQEYKKPEPGGYVCGITKVEDFPEKEYLKIEYDISEGEFKNYWRSLFNSKSFWGGSFIRSYTIKAQGFFKAFLTAVELSNHTFKVVDFNNDERQLKRMFIGLVLGEEEYRSNSGEIKKRLYVAETRSIQAIKNGDFKIPELKRIDDSGYSSKPSATTNTYVDFDEIGSDNDLPF